jgi:hypothetical protein
MCWHTSTTSLGHQRLTLAGKCVCDRPFQKDVKRLGADAHELMRADAIWWGSFRMHSFVIQCTTMCFEYIGDRTATSNNTTTAADKSLIPLWRQAWATHWALCTSGRHCIDRMGKNPLRTTMTMKLVSNSRVSDACCGSAVTCCIDTV